MDFLEMPLLGLNILYSLILLYLDQSVLISIYSKKESLMKFERYNKFMSIEMSLGVSLIPHLFNKVKVAFSFLGARVYLVIHLQP